MFKFIFWTLLFSLGIKFSYSSPLCENVRDGLQRTVCIANLIKESDRELNTEYKRLRKFLKTQTRNKLTVIQKQWLDYRDAKCPSTGRIDLTCIYDLTQKRSQFFRERNMECKIGNCNLEKILQEVKPAPHEYHCYWLNKKAKEKTWIPANRNGISTLEHCYISDSCNGGLGRSKGDCYKWAISEIAEGISYPPPIDLMPNQSSDNNYHPFGVQQNVPVADLKGWTRCWTGDYGNIINIDNIWFNCSNSKYHEILVGCLPAGSDTISVLAWTTSDFFLVPSNQTMARYDFLGGAHWYYNYRQAVGFAEDSIIQGEPCDIYNPKSNTRVCWNIFKAGFRCGSNLNLDGNHNWQQVVYKR